MVTATIFLGHIVYFSFLAQSCRGWGLENNESDINNNGLQIIAAIKGIKKRWSYLPKKKRRELNVMAPNKIY